MHSGGVGLGARGTGSPRLQVRKSRFRSANRLVLHSMVLVLYRVHVPLRGEEIYGLQKANRPRGLPPLEHLPGAPDSSESHDSTRVGSYRIGGAMSAPRHRVNRAARRPGESPGEPSPADNSPRAHPRRPGASKPREDVAWHRSHPSSASRRGRIVAPSRNRASVKFCPAGPRSRRRAPKSRTSMARNLAVRVEAPESARSVGESQN